MTPKALFQMTLSFVGLCLINGCTGIPKGLEPVNNFEVERYLGTWYEIARLDHPFERGLSNISAHYSLREDGGVRVINQGYMDEEAEWNLAEGKAYFIETPDVARLKVSFFGPFYGGYNVIALGEGYDYALISGPDLTYLWILAREQSLAPEIQDELVAKAKEAGFNTEALIWVTHDRENPNLPPKEAE